MIRGAPHSPLPLPPRQGPDFHAVPGVFRETFQKDAVGNIVVGLKGEYFQLFRHIDHLASQDVVVAGILAHDISRIMTDSNKTPKSPEELQKEIQDFIKDKFGGDVVTFPVGPDAMGDPPKDESQEEELKIPEAVLDFDMTPTQVKAYLDRFVLSLIHI